MVLTRESGSSSEQPRVIAMVAPQRWDSIWRDSPQLATQLAQDHEVIFFEPHHDVHETRFSSLRRPNLECFNLKIEPFPATGAGRPVDEQLPKSSALEQLREMPNVDWVGQHSPANLAGYMSGFSVGLIPYLLQGYVRSAYPLKVNEYLATGTSVVATALPELTDYDVSVAIGEDVDSFLRHVEQAIEHSNSSENREGRHALAAEHSSDKRAEIALRIIQTATEELT